MILLAATLPRPTYRWHEGVEDLEGYVPGGYHPVHIGDKYNKGRYEVVHKLGHGSHSTVWLARDHLKPRFVALKILVARTSANSSESQILSRLASGDASHPGRRHVASLLDEFCIVGPNGQHRCVVTEAVGCSVAESKAYSTVWVYPANLARSIGAQFLHGIAYLHSCGVAHGDLHPHNVLFKSPFFKATSVQDLYQGIGEPEKLPVQRLDKQPSGPEVPRYCVPPARFIQSCEDMTEANIVISDFGESFFFNNSDGGAQRELRTPVLLLPPEAIFKDPPGPAVDMWTAGCTLYEILGERPLFEGFMPVDCKKRLFSRGWFLERGHDSRPRTLVSSAFRAIGNHGA